MTQSLPNVEWVLEGDFNMIEWDGDRVEGHEMALQLDKGIG
jgi:hypothetical protein